MKNPTSFLLAVLVSCSGALLAQEAAPAPEAFQMDRAMMERYGLMPAPTRRGINAQPVAEDGRPLHERARREKRFSIDFKGGTAHDLIHQLEASMKRQLNVIVPDGLSDVYLPEFRVNNVTLQQVFTALGAASGQNTTVAPGFGGGMVSGWKLGFESTDPNPSDDSIYYFYDNETPQQSVGEQGSDECRFYNLTEYLDPLTVEDITTAVQTGWEMLGKRNVPRLSYHKQTKLLVAVGAVEELKLIDQVLSELKSPRSAGPSAFRRLPANASR